MKNFLLLILGISAVGWGATYYVSPTGSNDSAGTSSAPWRTGQYAEDRVGYGDTVIFENGRYNERITVYKASNDSARIVFKAHNKWLAIIDSGFNIRTTAVNLHNLYIKCPYYAGIGYDDKQGVWMRANRCSIIGCKFDSIGSAAIQSATLSPATWDSVVIDSCYFYGCNKFVNGTGRWWTVSNNTFERVLWYSEDADAMRCFGSYWTIRGNHFTGNRYADLDSIHPETHVDWIQTWGDSESTSGFHDAVIEGNLFDGHTNQGFLARSSVYNGKIYNIIWRNNIMRGCTSANLEFMGGCTGIEIYNNLFLNAADANAGLKIRENSTATIKNNIFLNASNNYFPDTNSEIDGSHNILNRNIEYPYYEDADDFIDIDPMIADTADSNYTLRAGSPAIDSGLNLSATGFSDDYAGRTRPQGTAWDIGPYEYFRKVCRVVIRR